jgi:hypothetical protein
MNAMKQPITLIAFLIFGLLVTHRASAQDTTAETKVFVGKMQQAYDKAAYLGFRLKYRYSNERQPGLYIDSLAGEVEMDKGRSRLVLAGMETVITGRYSIQIIPEDKLIYLGAARPAVIQNPLPVLDSLFTHIGGIRSMVEHSEASDQLTLDFPPGQPYYQIKIAIDNRTGYIRRVEYALSTAGLVGQDMIARPGHPAPYESRGRIEILFSDYEQGRFDDRIFQEQNFFTRVDGRYLPAGRYKDYHIYLASSNL